MSIAAVAAVAFLVLIFGATTHVHMDPDGDEGCAVHLAVVGKFEGPSSPPIVIPPASVAYRSQQTQGSPQIAAASPVVLPPSCGPPQLA